MPRPHPGVAGLLRSDRFLFAVASGAAFLLFGLLTLAWSHPEEDAYIMFRYAHHVVTGQGIVFNGVGPHAEGATDFLWMLMLAGLHAVGADLAVAAVILNALGAGLAAFVLGMAISSSIPRPTRWFWLLCTSVCVPLTSGATAAYGGFSAMLYSGLVLAATHLSLHGSRRIVSWLPPFALGLGLFRPDGVVLGGAIALLGAVRARDLSMERPYLKSAAAALAGGAVYYVWRRAYFGLALPLPLYVKSRVGEIEKLAKLPAAVQAIARRMPGLAADLHWLAVGGAIVAILVAGAALLLLLRSERSSSRLVRRAIGALPFAMLFASLAFAYQTQNLSWRFQAPIQLAALYFAARGVSAVVVRHLVPTAVGTLMLLGSALCLMQPGVANLQNDLSEAKGGYLNGFAARYGQVMAPGTKVALTEAGRVPYWSPTEVLDTVGLNSPSVAVHPVTRPILSAFGPQVVFFHHAATMDFSSVSRDAPVIRITSLGSPMIRDTYREAYQRDFTEYSEFAYSSIRLPPLVMTRYLEDNADEYTVFAVDADGDGSYSHVWGFRKDMDAERALALLRDAIDAGNRPSYFAILRERSQASAVPGGS